MNCVKVLFFSCVSLLIAASTTLLAKEFKRQNTLVPSDTSHGQGNVSNGFGVAVKKNKNFVFVNAPTAFPGNNGAAFVYEKHGKHYRQTQLIKGLMAMNIVGAAQVDSKGDWLVISRLGTPGGTSLNPQGSVLIYHLDKHSGKWKFHQILDSHTKGLEHLSSISPNDTFLPVTNQFEHGAYFGLFFSLDAEHGHLLVAAQYQENDDKINSGTVYAFDLNPKSNKWELVQKIKNPHRFINNDSFGANVAIHGDLALIGTGALFSFPKEKNGSVYVFQHEDGKWKFRQKLVGEQHKPSRMAKAITSINWIIGDPPKVGDGFGAAIATNGKWAVISAPAEHRTSHHRLAGAAYFYKVEEKDGKKRLKRVQKAFSNSKHTNLTGLLHVDVQDDTIVVGDPGRKGPKGPRQGGILVYNLKHGKWKLTEVVHDPHGTAYSFFGEGVALREKHLIGGTDNVAFPAVGRAVGLTFPNPLPNIPVKAVVFKKKDR